MRAATPRVPATRSTSRETPENYERPSLARRGASGGEGPSAKLTGDTAAGPRWTSASNPSWATLSRSRARSRTWSARGARGARQVRGNLPAAGAEEAYEGQGSSRLPRAVRARLADELLRRRGTPIGEHLKLVLSIIDRQVH
jgi:hypothetical protein